MNKVLIKKLIIKEEQTVLLINCPEELEADFEGLSLEKNYATKKAYDSVIIFVHNENELAELLPKNQKFSKKDGETIGGLS